MLKGRNSWQQDISNISYVYAICGGLLGLGVIAYLFYHNIWAMCCFLPLLVPGVKSWEYQKEQSLRKEFQIQLKDYLQALSAALSTGYALENAMVEARGELCQQYPSKARIMRDTLVMEQLLKMNMPPDQVWNEWAKRTDLRELQQFTEVFIIAKKSGGNANEIIKNAIINICDSVELEMEIQVILAGKKLEFQIMCLVPFGIIGYMTWSFPDFMDVLYGNLFGVALMSGCLAICALAVGWGNRMIQIKV